ncbi:MAG: class I SAM-dependent methyltransferase [Jatrophihabitantaceae bacterium]
MAEVRCDCCGSGEWRELFSENGIRLGRCPRCELLSVAELPSRDSRMTELEEGHFAAARQVLDAGKQLEAERVLAARFRGYVELARTFAPTGDWLDIGCGAGLLLTLARESGYHGAGIELNADRRAAAAEVTGLPMHDRPVEDVRFADGSFDVISLINVFSHLTSPAATFAELRRILKPEGVLIVATGEITAGVRKSHLPDWNLGDHLYFLGDHTMEQYAARAGFDIAHHERSWFPELLYSRESLESKGRSGVRNAVKTAILKTPGAFATFRSVMLRRAAGSAAHAGVFALRPTLDAGGTR